MIWALGVLLSFGIAAPILFAIAGSQAHKRAWTLWGVVYGVLSWGGIAIATSTAEGSALNTLSGGMILVGWIASSAHAFAVRKEYRQRVSGAGLDPLEAARNVDGFKSLEDCGGVLELDADVVEDLRPFVVFLPR